MPGVDFSSLPPELAYTLGDVLGTWIIFRQTHDLESPKFKCCETSQKLFDALRRYEEIMRR